ncbi:MAG: hypothetical protein AB7P14_02930 [Blastocatellales bacterium]
MNRSKHRIRYLFLLAMSFAMLIKVIAALPVKKMLSPDQKPTLRSNDNNEEAYFLIDVPPRKETFTIKLTDPVKIQKARDILNGKDQSTPHVGGTIVKEPACYNPPWSFHLDPQSLDFFASSIEVCDASIAYTESFLDEAGGHFLPGNHWCPWGSRLVREIPAPACGNSITSVSAANYKRVGLAGESIVTAFGSGLSATTEVVNTLPLPTTLAGTTVKIKDSTGKEMLAPLFFVSPAQINYQIPLGIETGLATVTVANLQGAVAVEQTQILTIAAGLFTANATGQGVPAAVALRIKAGGTQVYEPVAQFDQSQGRFAPIPIELGERTDQVFLVIFGTGFRNGDQSMIDARIGGQFAEVVYSGPQTGFTGLDQINIRLPGRLSASGEVVVELLFDDQKANPVVIAVK